MREAIAELHGIEAQTGVVCGSIATYFFLADTPDMGASVYIVTDDDQAFAQTYADQLGNWIYERRAVWQLKLLSARASPCRRGSLTDATPSFSPICRTTPAAGRRAIAQASCAP